ncbi:MAG: hypothetical protein RLZZ200_2623 [Pseudomonadota bacterium]|jgi:hypothetical protein
MEGQNLEELLERLTAPTSQKEWQRVAGHFIGETYRQAKSTNGRVTTLEQRVKLLFAGGVCLLIGLGIINPNYLLRFFG